jgi:5-methylcytosine-specific restriction endonuclease McrA
MSRTNKLKCRKLREKVWKNCNGICVSCSEPMILNSYGSNPPWDCSEPHMYTNGLNSKVFSLDHKKPYSKGGSDNIRNLQGMCITCNRSKKNGS